MKLIYDNFHGNIEFSALEGKLLQSPLLNRLHQILQNSTAYLVYPCCKTSRFEHSVGTMDYASKIFTNSFANSLVVEDYLDEKADLIRTILKNNEDAFFKYQKPSQVGFAPIEKTRLFKKYAIDNIQELLGNDNFKESLITYLGRDFVNRNGWFTYGGNNPIHKSLSDTDLNTFLLLQSTLRIAALFHDIGHLPFSHLFEFAIETVQNSLKKQENSLEGNKKLIYSYLKEIVREDEKVHERIGKEIIKFIFSKLKEEEKDNITNIIILSIIEELIKEIRSSENSKLGSLYKIISGTIDADRLDFIQRDGSNSGIAISTGNIERIIKFFNLTAIQEKFHKGDYDKFLFLPSIQSIHDLEAILYDRYKIYKFMVNHHAVKRTDHILQSIIEYKLKHEIDSFDKQKKLPWDKKTNFNITKVSEVIKITHNALKSTAPDTDFQYVVYQFFQLTDFWILALLNKDFNDYLTKKRSTYKFFLSQIYENKRHFVSLWKRGYEYEQFLMEFGTYSFSQLIKSERKIIPLDERHLEFEVNKKILDTFEDIKKLHKKKQTEEQKIEINQLFLRLGKQIIHLLRKIHKQGEWCIDVEKKINNGETIVLLSQSRLKDGFDHEPLLLIDNKTKKIAGRFEDFSSMRQAIRDDIEKSISFFVFYHNINTTFDKDTLKLRLIESLYQIFFDEITSHRELLKKYEKQPIKV